MAPLFPMQTFQSLGELECFIQSVNYDNIFICGDFKVDFNGAGHHLTSLTDGNSAVDYTFCR